MLLEGCTVVLPGAILPVDVVGRGVLLSVGQDVRSLYIKPSHFSDLV